VSAVGSPIPAPPEPRRILVAGDVHMNLDWLAELIRVARDEGCQAIVQLGDFGFFPRWATGAAFLAGAQRLLDAAGLRLYFLDGNHDDHDSLRRLKLPLAGPFVAYGERLFYLPRGCRFTWLGVRFLAVGGAYSIDREQRLEAERQRQTPRSFYWPEEVLSERDVRRASLEGHTDLLLAHNCPAGVAIPGINDTYPGAEENRRLLGRIVDATRPRLLLHGHYHLRSEGLYSNRLLGLRVPTIGLAHEHTGRDGWLVLDLEHLELPGAGS
jgi:predicted phosphodiesterase